MTSVTIILVTLLLVGIFIAIPCGLGIIIEYIRTDGDPNPFFTALWYLILLSIMIGVLVTLYPEAFGTP